ncbi:DUF6074 family protein [Devosia naphthalenivorans]|uniref:DUF6074 family protein n=1 Tax=Devosia naphthalenivorans TaxID=2082392 RepID=UPI000D3600C8|nr:DUF6074 family protein [Devosia naphthalenivorans]
MTQLDLCRETPKNPTACALLLPFPIARRRKLILKTVSTILARKTTEGQQSYWTNTINKLGAELRRYGADQAEVDRQLQAFYFAVSAELSRATHQQPGGAA